MDSIITSLYLLLNALKTSFLWRVRVVIDISTLVNWELTYSFWAVLGISPHLARVRPVL